MKKWIKRLLLLVAITLCGVIAFALYGIHLYRGTPKWYHHKVATTQQVEDAANRADQKLLDLFSWAATVRAEQLRRLNGISKPGEVPAGSKTIILDEDEINSFVSAWKNPDKNVLQERISRYFTDGRVVFEDDSLILVGQSPSFGTVASAQFLPAIDAEGNLRLDLDSIRAGMLPVPQSMLSARLARLQTLLHQQLNIEQATAQIDPAQTANTAALASSWLRLLLCSMNSKPADPVLIIPFDMTNLHHGLPVKLTAIKVGEGRITMTLEPVTAGDQTKLLQRLKEPLSMAQ